MNNIQIKLTPMKKAMAKQMIKGLEIPQFQLETELDCTKLMKLRKDVSYKPSVTSVLAFATAQILKKHDIFNASWGDGTYIEMHDQIGLGIAADTSKGLVVPVIHDAGSLELKGIHEALEIIKEKSQKGNFSIDEITGGTFTISNLGMYNITSFKALVNFPQAAILALSKIAERPIITNGKVTSAMIMRITLSIDHRIADGAAGAEFLCDLAELIKNPEELF
ncbi:MAG: 2-oxo acid dehydrogenase subunit E2 [Oscillospiraceae bacterium]